MKKCVRTPGLVLAALLMMTVPAPFSNAQITGLMQANIPHSFMIGDKVFPPGQYTFRMESNTNLNVMTVQNQKGDNLAQFAVRESTADHTPRHSELVFRKFGNTEFLSKIYERGSKIGSALTETGKEEQRMVSQGLHATEHTEEQRDNQ